MDIHVTSGTGEGPTPIAAFDAALINAGVANYNLIYLSSVIPGGSVIRRSRFPARADEFGHRLYVVISRHDEQQVGRSAWAGVGWTQHAGSGRGLFVEVHGASRPQVEAEIDQSLKAMMIARPFIDGPVETEISGIECRGQPVCALAIAVYESVGWSVDPARAQL